MRRGDFLRSLLGAPAVAVGAVQREAERSDEQLTKVLTLHSADNATTFRIPYKPARPKPDTALAWSHDEDGNWYVENTATGRRTRL